jgi:hypothetical protein
VLERLAAHSPSQPLHYWRDKAGRELDFVLARRRNHLVCPISMPAYRKRFGDLEVKVCVPAGFQSNAA